MQNGIGTKIDEMQAKQIFSKLKVPILQLAQAGDCWAQYIVSNKNNSEYYSYIETDGKQRLKMLERSALENVVAMKYLADTLRETNPEEMIRLLKVAASYNSTDAQFELAKEYLNGKRVPEDHSQTFELYQKASLQGHMQATYELALCYVYGIGVEVDDVKARYLADRAFDNGFLQAGVFIIDTWTDNGDSFNAKRICSVINESGNTKVINDLAYIYLTKSHLNKYKGRARTLYEISHFLGDTGGTYGLAMTYKGNSCANFKNYLKRSAKEGNLEANLEIGDAYFNGDNSFSRQLSKAFDFYEKSVQLKGKDEEIAQAHYKLARCYYYGYGCERDYHQAFQYLTKVVELGYDEIGEFEKAKQLRTMCYQKICS